MTRFLSESLESISPLFAQTLTKLERASGHPSIDIRYTLEVKSKTKDKINELSLDPHDTTARELYQALQQKLLNDDAVLLKKLRTRAATVVSAEADPIDGMIDSLNSIKDNKRCFALKLIKLKQLIKQNPPKKTMKALGYRSIDSMLKREHPVLIIAAASVVESSLWHKKYVDQYKKLSVSDFEERDAVFIKPKNQKYLDVFKGLKNSNIICYRELGTIIIMPLGHNLPAGFITASLCTALVKLNDIRATSSYLKVHQVRGNFGQLVAKLSHSEPEVNFDHLDMRLPWSLVHRYYLKIAKVLNYDLFDPYLRLEDMMWRSIEKSLNDIAPELSFWKGTSHLGYKLDRSRPVSLNVLDCAINLCNRLNFENQINHYFSHNLWQGLMLKYINQPPLSGFKPRELVEEEALSV